MFEEWALTSPATPCINRANELDTMHARWSTGASLSAESVPLPSPGIAVLRAANQNPKIKPAASNRQPTTKPPMKNNVVIAILTVPTDGTRRNAQVNSRNYLYAKTVVTRCWYETIGLDNPSPG